jgi:RNA polymerase sigma factor for flagellar operon FliA
MYRKVPTTTPCFVSVAQIDSKADAVTAAPVLSLVGHALRAQGEEGERLRATYARILQATEAALAALAEAERRILTAQYFEGRAWQEIGAERGWSERTARRHGADARTRFAQAMRAQRGEAEAAPTGADGGAPG